MLTRSVFSKYDPIDIDFRDYSPSANGQKVSDGAITSGQTALTSASGLFVAGDVGKYIVVTGAGVAGANLHTTIAAYVSPTQVTLTASASTTVSNANVSWGTDDSAKLQDAINDAYTAGGARIILPINRYYCTGVLAMKYGVSIVGGATGPYDPGRDNSGPRNPGKVTVAPTLMVVNESNPFIGVAIRENQVCLSNFLIYYPNQVAPSASAPRVYPYTVALTSESIAGFKMFDMTIVNAYNGIQLYGGRHYIDRLNLGALNIGILIDGCRDTDRLNNIQMTPFWDTVNGLGGGQPIDTWCLNNSKGLVIRSADLVIIDSLFMFWKDVAITLEDSTTYTSPFSNSYGLADNINLDTVQYGIRAKSTNPTSYIDWEFGKIQFGSDGSGVTAVWLEAGGSSAPQVTLMGGALWGNWTNASVVNAGSLKSYGVRGIADTQGGTFLSLSDTPSSYTGQGGKLVAVNSGATALEFVSKGVTVTETDGSPSVAASTIKFPSGSVTDNGGGIVTVSVGGNNFDDGYFGEPEGGNLSIDDGTFGDGN